MAGWLIGVDGCKAGWIAAVLRPDDPVPRLIRFPVFQPLIDAALAGSVVMVDIPIGLSDVTEPGGRSTERHCRGLLKGKASSIFSTPSRSALFSADRLAACAQVASELPGRKGISAQSWAISPKIREVDAYFDKPKPGVAVKETHPEVIFTVLNGGSPVLASKKTAEGQRARIALIREAGIDASVAVAERMPGTSRDDRIDAFACLVAAIRFQQGRARAFDEGDVKFDTRGREQAIWV